MESASASFVVTSLNLHAGVDGWGRPFDVVGVCRQLDADLLVLQETWVPQAEGQRGLAATVGAALGYRVFEQPLARGRLAGPHPEADGRWMRPLDWRGSAHAIYLDDHRPLGPAITRTDRFQGASPGTWGMALLTRLPVIEHRLVELTPLSRDRSERGAVVVRVEVEGQPVTAVGTHMSHLSYGSPRHFRQLARILQDQVGQDPAVLVGDMNLWGPPVSAFFSGWRRVVRGPTWPAWRPHSQVDHILVRGPLEALDGQVLPMSGSDHRPVRARLALRSPSTVSG